MERLMENRVQNKTTTTIRESVTITKIFVMDKTLLHYQLKRKDRRKVLQRDKNISTNEAAPAAAGRKLKGAALSPLHSCCDRFRLLLDIVSG